MPIRVAHGCGEKRDIWASRQRTRTQTRGASDLIKKDLSQHLTELSLHPNLCTESLYPCFLSINLLQPHFRGAVVTMLAMLCDGLLSTPKLSMPSFNLTPSPQLNNVGRNIRLGPGYSGRVQQHCLCRLMVTYNLNRTLTLLHCSFQQPLSPNGQYLHQ